ncbi:E3 ubiquitin ligase TRAF3IP2 isoform X2 [Osmerus eperlanus]
MTSSMDLAWLTSCQRCSGPGERPRERYRSSPEETFDYTCLGSPELPETLRTPSPSGNVSQHQSQLRDAVLPWGDLSPPLPDRPDPLNPAHPRSHSHKWGQHRDEPGAYQREAEIYPQSPDQAEEHSVEGAESLELPLSLKSDFDNLLCQPAQPYKWSSPVDLPFQRRPPPHPACHGCTKHHHYIHPQENHHHPSARTLATQSRPRGQEVSRPPRITPPRFVSPPRQVMSEISVVPSFPGLRSPGHSAGTTQEIKKTICLPDHCRKVFITYSVDTHKEIPTFVSFLINQGFKPSIDIFESSIRTMDINKWMDTNLKDKSMLIIVVISPKYKTDVEGDGMDEHGLHTKYIHTQIQNEFIQQRCLNFRLVPVLFPNVTKNHVPSWLQTTRIYRWPDDSNDLLLRLLREERYIPPPLGKDLTITMRPL